MKKTFKKIISSVLVAVTLVSVAPLSEIKNLNINLDWLDFSTKSSAYRNSDNQLGENVYWSLDEDTGLLTISGSGDMDTTYLCDNADGPLYMKPIKTIVIEDGITSVSKYAFCSCLTVTDVFISKSVKSIGNGAFIGCTKLTNIELSEGLERIGDGAFIGCTKLTSIVIPDTVTEIGEEAFSDCNSLKSVTLSQNISIIKYSTFYSCENLNGLVIPENVKKIDTGAFDYCKELTEIIIPDGVTSIEVSAFSHCANLRNVSIPNSVTSIEKYAFNGCTKLDSITVPKGVTYIGEGALEGVCNIIYNGEATGSPWGAKTVNGFVEDGLVYTNNLKVELVGCYSSKKGTVTIPESVITIGKSAFENCDEITEVVMSDSVTTIDDRAFSGCAKLKKVIFSNKLITVGENAFEDCKNLKRIRIPDSVTELKKSAFGGLGNDLLIVTLGKGLIDIKDVFSPYANEKQVFFVYKNTYAETYVKANNFKYVVKSEVSEAENEISGTVNDNFSWSINIDSKTLYLNCVGAMTAFDNEAAPWISYKDYYNKAVISDGCTNIGENTFRYCDNLTSVQIPDSVSQIGQNAFNLCFSLSEIVIPNKVERIEPYSFYSCDSLARVVMSGHVKFIGNGSFEYCKNLADINIPDTVTTIGYRAFVACSLKNLVIPDSVTSIGELAFASCDMEEVVLSKNLKKISGNLFLGCKNFKNVIIPSGVEKIELGAFACCDNLKTVIIPSSVEEIGDMAFGECPLLSLVSIEADNIKLEMNTTDINGETVAEGYDIVSNEDVTFLAKKDSVTYNSLIGRGYNTIPYSFTVNKEDKDKPMLAFDGKVVLSEDMWSSICSLIRDTDVQYIYFEKLDFGNIMPEYIIKDFDEGSFVYEKAVLSIIKDGETIRLGSIEEKSSFQLFFEKLVEAFTFVLDSVISGAKSLWASIKKWFR